MNSQEDENQLTRTKKLSNPEFQTFCKSQPELAHLIFSINTYFKNCPFIYDSILSLNKGRPIDVIEKRLKEELERLNEGKSTYQVVQKALASREKCIQKIKRELARARRVLKMFTKCYFHEQDIQHLAYLDYVQNQGYSTVQIDETVQSSIQLINSIFMDMSRLRDMTIYIIETIHKWKLQIQEWKDKCGQYEEVSYFHNDQNVYEMVLSDTQFIWQSTLKSYIYVSTKKDPFIVRNVFEIHKREDKTILEKYFVQMLYPKSQQTLLNALKCYEMLTYKFQPQVNEKKEEQLLIESYLNLGKKIRQQEAEDNIEQKRYEWENKLKNDQKAILNSRKGNISRVIKNPSQQKVKAMIQRHQHKVTFINSFNTTNYEQKNALALAYLSRVSSPKDPKTLSRQENKQQSSINKNQNSEVKSTHNTNKSFSLKKLVYENQKDRLLSSSLPKNKGFKVHQSLSKLSNKALKQPIERNIQTGRNKQKKDKEVSEKDKKASIDKNVMEMSGSLKLDKIISKKLEPISDEKKTPASHQKIIPISHSSIIPSSNQNQDSLYNDQHIQKLQEQQQQNTNITKPKDKSITKRIHKPTKIMPKQLSTMKLNSFIEPASEDTQTDENKKINESEDERKTHASIYVQSGYESIDCDELFEELTFISEGNEENEKKQGEKNMKKEKISGGEEKEKKEARQGTLERKERLEKNQQKLSQVRIFLKGHSKILQPHQKRSTISSPSTKQRSVSLKKHQSPKDQSRQKYDKRQNNKLSNQSTNLKKDENSFINYTKQQTREPKQPINNNQSFRFLEDLIILKPKSIPVDIVPDYMQHLFSQLNPTSKKFTFYSLSQILSKLTNPYLNCIVFDVHSGKKGQIGQIILTQSIKNHKLKYTIEFIHITYLELFISAILKVAQQLIHLTPCSEVICPLMEDKRDSVSVHFVELIENAFSSKVKGFGQLGIFEKNDMNGNEAHLIERLYVFTPKNSENKAKIRLPKQIVSNYRSLRFQCKCLLLSSNFPMRSKSLIKKQSHYDHISIGNLYRSILRRILTRHHMKQLKASSSSQDHGWLHKNNFLKTAITSLAYHMKDQKQSEKDEEGLIYLTRFKHMSDVVTYLDYKGYLREFAFNQFQESRFHLNHELFLAEVNVEFSLEFMVRSSAQFLILTNHHNFRLKLINKVTSKGLMLPTTNQDIEIIFIQGKQYLQQSINKLDLFTYIYFYQRNLSTYEQTTAKEIIIPKMYTLTPVSSGVEMFDGMSRLFPDKEFFSGAYFNCVNLWESYFPPAVVYKHSSDTVVFEYPLIVGLVDKKRNQILTAFLLNKNH